MLIYTRDFLVVWKDKTDTIDKSVIIKQVLNFYSRVLNKLYNLYKCIYIFSNTFYITIIKNYVLYS